MYGRLVVTGIMVTLLSGCSAGFRPSLEDYKGSDAARIRAASDGNTALQFFEKQTSGCYKKVLERRITSGLAVMGIPVTGNKKIGMPDSSYNKGSFINEFTIKPGQLVRVIHYWTEAGYYQNTQRSDTYTFIPQAKHDYDIVVTGSEYSGDSVSVRDMDPNAKIVDWKADNICPSGTFD
ncbi:Uncharacterised protein [Yersinia intermedia]|uniref:hypothetical protein n=1 Tax=Yersinia intermedia TaxID=631 RepID=UPI0005AC5D96|nr:hypothetical protein [Yersinia intermedia]AJJ19146.1 hypothetical protein CH53_3976 [Yersinia intermedia]MCB5296606.1 hypothetical protein [Yersinia intermedia]MDA5510423.1 hypothetical protein [Yersinia intermedia]MDN0113493.1 hypothetical protein [Yersinia intermedia]CNH90073.1 Uncharacterised protein [Yersinia intermedia]